MFAIVFIPFGAYAHTRFLFERVIGAIFNLGVKVGMLTFLMFITSPILQSTVETFRKQPNISGSLIAILGMMFTIIVMFMLTRQAPALAAGLLSGNPTLGGSSLTSVAAGMAGGALGAAGVIKAASKKDDGKDGKGEKGGGDSASGGGGSGGGGSGGGGSGSSGGGGGSSGGGGKGGADTRAGDKEHEDSGYKPVGGTGESEAGGEGSGGEAGGSSGGESGSGSAEGGSSGGSGGSGGGSGGSGSGGKEDLCGLKKTIDAMKADWNGGIANELKDTGKHMKNAVAESDTGKYVTGKINKAAGAINKAAEGKSGTAAYVGANALKGGASAVGSAARVLGRTGKNLAKMGAKAAMDKAVPWRTEAFENGRQLGEKLLTHKGSHYKNTDVTRDEKLQKGINAISAHLGIKTDDTDD